MMATHILGINCYTHDASAALLRDGAVVFAAAEERFSRVKKDNSFPRRAIQTALTYAGIEFRDLDAVAFGWNRPGLTPLHTLRSALMGRIQPSPRYTAGSLYGLIGELYHGNGLGALRWWFDHLPKERIYHIDHHEAHAWSTYALSGFDEALVLVMDGRGAYQASTIYHGRGGRLTRLRVYPWPNSIGAFYEAFTDLLGFERHSDEWKVMGLAAYGRPTVPLHDCLRVTHTGYRVNGRVLCGRHPADIEPLVRRFGPRRDPETHIAEADKDLAASVQKATEDAIVTLVREGIHLTGCRRLCLAGGVAMNSKANGNLLASGLIDDIFIQPAATDDGTAIGAALGVYAARGQHVPRAVMEHVYLGPDCTDAEVEQALRSYKLPATRVPDIAKVTARLLAQGFIVGWFQGRMEFGPRALGNRSILADPRDARMKDRVNECVKFREGWRPFAPACLAEKAHEYFQPAYPSPFMILTFTVRPEKRAMIPAVTHADHSARVQTVERRVNPRFWALIAAFERLTGVPVVLNTSFNLRGEPIVCTPKDAIRTFYSSGLDFLALGDFLLAKDPDALRQAVTTGTAVDGVAFAADRPSLPTDP